MPQALRHRHPTALRLSVALVAIALLTTACGDDDADVASTPTTTAAAETTTSTTAAATGGASGDYGGASSATTTESMTADTGATPAVDVAETDLGTILVADGRTLYAFTPDTEGVSTCYDECATNWPPLLATGEVKVEGDLDPELFATSARTDGGQQVTVDGHPLYYFASDAAPGDINGQGVADKWYVVGADGALIMA